MLQYASLKAVIQYLDANIRFKIYNRCPSIRKTERAVPLYIDRLKYFPNENGPKKVIVNSTTYSIGTIRVYPSGAKIPNNHDVENLKGGVGSDLDQFGFRDNTSDSYLTLGDIRVGRPRTTWQLGEDQIDELLRELEAVDMLLALKCSGKPLILERQHPQFYILQYFENQSVKVIQTFVSGRRHILLPYLNRRNNTTVPYTTEIQMTVTRRRRESEREYRYPGRKLYQVEKKLLTMFFGSRKHIHVKTLEIYDTMIFRFPVDVLIRVQHMYMTDNMFNELDAISQFVHPTCLPLETIKLQRLGENESQHAIVKSAKKLIILGVCRQMPTLLEVTTQKVEVEKPNFDPEDYLVLARNWLETRRTVGTCYVFKFKKVSVVEEVMRVLKTELDAKVIGAECLKVRINDTSKLKIAYQKVEKKWRMQFKVVLE